MKNLYALILIAAVSACTFAVDAKPNNGTSVLDIAQNLKFQAMMNFEGANFK